MSNMNFLCYSSNLSFTSAFDVFKQLLTSQLFSSKAIVPLMVREDAFSFTFMNVTARYPFYPYCKK